MDSENEIERLNAVEDLDELRGLTVSLEQDIVNRKNLFMMMGTLGYEGNGISTVQYAYPIGTFNIKKGQESTIKITHNMRSELLNGIHDIGVKIVEAE